jgi:hypothetical protein
MSGLRPAQDHVHAFNFHTGRPRFHFDEAGDAAAAAAAAAASAAKPWHDGIEAETVGFWQNKGYDVADPKKLAAELTKQYRAAEKHIGAPPDQIVRLPKADAPPEEIAAFRQRLGMPAEPKDYDFSTVKTAKGEAIPQALADTLRASFHSKGIAKDAAPALAADIVKHLDGVTTTQNTLDAAKIAEQRILLDKNWGGKDSATYQYNHLQAIEGARRLGITPEAVKLMENHLGYASVMDSMRKIGAARSEDIFVEAGQSGSAGKVTTREGALSRKQELMADKNGWAKRYLDGDAEAKREMAQLNSMILGDVA